MSKRLSEQAGGARQVIYGDCFGEDPRLAEHRARAARIVPLSCRAVAVALNSLIPAPRGALAARSADDHWTFDLRRFRDFAVPK